MSSEVQIAVIDQQDTQIVLAVPGVQGATGSPISAGGTANQVLRKASSTNYDTDWSLVTNAMVDSSAAIAGTKISPNFGSQNVVTTGTSTAASFIPTSSSVPTNGVYLPSANNVAISTNGAQRLLIDSSGNINIDSNTLYVDASNNRVGVKTNSPIGDFHVNGTTITFRGGDGTSARTLELGANATGGGTAISNIRLATYGGDYGALIRGQADYNNNLGSSLQFSTSTTGGTVTERMRLDNAGRLGLGTSSPSSLLHLNAASGSVQTQYNNGGTSTYIGIDSGFTGCDIAAGGGIRFRYFSGGSYQNGMVLDTSGRLGIGTAAPGATLDICPVSDRGIRFSGTLASHSQIVGTQGTTSGNLRPLIIAGSELSFATGSAVGTSFTEYLKIDGTGRVGIGTTSPSELLHVAGGNARIGNSSGGGQAVIYNGANSELLLWEGNGVSGNADTTRLGVGRNNTSLICPNNSGTPRTAFAVGTVAAEPLVFSTNNTERARIDSSGRLLIGTSSGSDNNALLKVQGNAAGSTGAGWVDIRVGAAVSTNQQVGYLSFSNNSGNTFAGIDCYADGATGSGDYPGRLVFSTTADGASSPTERLRITNDGVKAYDQTAPAAVNATATLTVANLKTGIITSTSAAATDMTLPTGTDTEAGFSGVYTNMTFEWSVINTGPSLVRVLAGTAHTIVGSGSVATGTSGRFASRRTAANTFVTYRLS